MSRATINDLTTEGRYAQVNWRRDEHEPGYVQLSTHGPDSLQGEYVHLDSAGIDQFIYELQQAKLDAYGEPPRQAVMEPYTEEAAVTPR